MDTRKAMGLVATGAVAVATVIWVVSSPDPAASLNVAGIAGTAIAVVALVASLAVEGRHFHAVTQPGVYVLFAGVLLLVAGQTLINGREWLAVAVLIGAVTMVVVAIRARSSAAQPN